MSQFPVNVAYSNIITMLHSASRQNTRFDSAKKELLFHIFIHYSNLFFKFSEKMKVDTISSFLFNFMFAILM